LYTLIQLLAAVYKIKTSLSTNRLIRRKQDHPPDYERTSSGSAHRDIHRWRIQVVRWIFQLLNRIQCAEVPTAFRRNLRRQRRSAQS